MRQMVIQLGLRNALKFNVIYKIQRDFAPIERAEID